MAVLTAEGWMERFGVQFVPEPNTGCWLWVGSVDGCGYGMVYDPRVKHSARAHRVAYEMLRGMIPAGLTIDHLCRVKGCVNPDHLEPVTLRENILRSDNVAGRHARQTHCKRGHLLAGDNLYLGSGRQCRVCWMARYYERRTEIIARRRIRDSANRDEINRKRREYRRKKGQGAPSLS